MLSPDDQTLEISADHKGKASVPDTLTMELLELELALDGVDMDTPDFVTRVTRAATDMQGVFLFDLPASGLIETCNRIAVLRIPHDGTTIMETVFACLEPDGTTIRVELPDEKTADLRNFAEAFVDVLKRI